jgi:hypothetical protein
MQRAIQQLLYIDQSICYSQEEVSIWLPLSNVAACAAAVHGAEADELTDSDDTPRWAYLPSCDSIPTSENVKNQTKREKKRKSKGNYQRRNSTKSRKSQTQQCLCRSSSFQVDTLSKGASLESDGDSTAEFLRRTNTKWSGPLNRRTARQKMKRSSKTKRGIMWNWKG